MTLDNVKKISESDVEKYYKRNEAALASRVTETLVNGFLKLTCKAVGMAVKIDDTKNYTVTQRMII